MGKDMLVYVPYYVEWREDEGEEEFSVEKIERISDRVGGGKVRWK